MHTYYKQENGRGIARRIVTVMLSLAVIISFMPVLGSVTGGAVGAQDVHAEAADYSAKLTFSNSEITETTAGSGYSISGTTLTISAAGTYDIAGTCSEGSIVVSKAVSGEVTLILDGLTLASSSTAPILIKKGNTVNIHLADDTTSTLTDAETDSSDSNYEGAVIKVKSDADTISNVTFCGGGDLNVVAKAKNGIKGGSCAALTFNQSGTIAVSGNSGSYATTSGAVNNGIASDGSLVFNQGTFDIDAANDGIKSTPDATDETEGTTIDTDSAGTITINGGTFDIDVDGDGIQADTALTINNGTLNIKTLNGYNSTGTKVNGSSSGIFDSDSMSCKGIKASGDRAEEAEIEPEINVAGGDFTFNTADDAVHSDAYVTVTGGTFAIKTGDDGMHADTSLILGTSGSNVERDPYVTISNSYEGLEGGYVYMYQGVYSVTASDDGVNAAGGSDSSGGETGGGGFNPGGGGPGGNMPGNMSGQSVSTASTDDYSIQISGGDLYVNCEGDGLDSNGTLYLTGGQQAVFSQASGGENSAIDADGTISIAGATVFTAGTAGVNGSVQSGWFGSSQKYAASTTSYSAGKVLNAKAGSNGSVILSYKLPKTSNYTMASWPTSVSSSAPSFATATSVTACKGGSQSHSWDSGSTSNGVTTYTCSDCNETETQTVADTVTVEACDHSVEVEETEDEGYTVTFAGDSGVASIVVYETQDTSGASETISATGTSVSRNSTTGDPDSTGSGQINFLININDGYSLDSVTATEGTYTNIKVISDNLYRITKITDDTTVTITTATCAHSTLADGSEPEWTWAEDYSTATLAYTCGDCEEYVELEGAITSELVDGSITFTATASIGETEYTDTVSGVTPFTGTFDTDEGVESIDVYYTQDYTDADEENVSTAVARDGDTGYPVISGEGQINFLVNIKDGYHIDSVTATSGAYKNIKEPDETGEDNTYRITKVKKDLTITVTTEACTYGDPEWTWADDYSSATATFTCTECETAVTKDAEVTSTTSGTTTTYTATVTLNDTEYTDTQSVTASSDSSSTSDSTTTDSSLGSDGTAYGKGATLAAVTSAITSRSSDTDPAGTVYSKLRLRSTKQTKKTIKLNWNKPSGAVKYVIYANKCGKSNKMKKLATTTAKTYTVKKVAGKKLKKGTYYKFIVVALDKNNKVVSTSKIIHIATKGGKVKNPTKVTVKKTSVTLKTGKTYKMGAKQYGSKVKKHRALKYESSNTSVATVTAKGVVKAKAKGSCYIYAYAQNGIYKRTKITVK